MNCEHDVQYDARKSLVMYFDSRNANLAREMTLGVKKLNFATSCKYVGYVICNDLSLRLKFKPNLDFCMLRVTCCVKSFAFHSTAIKNTLVTAYFSTIYMCALWVNCRKPNFQKDVVAYDNSYRMLN